MDGDGWWLRALLLLIVEDHLRCRFAHLDFRAHLLQASSKGFNLLLVMRGSRLEVFLPLYNDARKRESFGKGSLVSQQKRGVQQNRSSFLLIVAPGLRGWRRRCGWSRCRRGGRRGGRRWFNCQRCVIAGHTPSAVTHSHCEESTVVGYCCRWSGI
jgi:hypothetical protein